MINKITEFQGEYRWLSNFWPVKVILNGLEYESVEHAYQAAKTEVPSQIAWVRNSPSPSIAKRRGRQVTIRANWNKIRLVVMEDLVRQKFNQEPFRSKLLATKDWLIEEGNKWGDVFWGINIRNGKGLNNLGKIIMKIRDEIRNQSKE